MGFGSGGGPLGAAITRTTAGSETVADEAILEALRAVARGDFSVRLPAGEPGLAGQLFDTVNEIVELNEHVAAELHRIRRAVGHEGRFGERAVIGAAQG